MKKKQGEILVAAFLGGAASVVYELIWTRYLALLLGSSAYAIGVVTACYMVGLAVGGFALGRLADFREKWSIVLSFGGFGLLCAASPILYKGIQRLYLILAQGENGGSLWLRVLISMAGLFLPTFFIGGMTPILVKYYQQKTNSMMVYAMFTLGSVAGVVLTGFWMIPAVGLSGSGIVGGVCACAGMLCLRGSIAAECSEECKDKVKPYPTSIRLCVVIVYAVSGFTAMAYQMYQTKLLTLFFMDSVYDFTLILMIFLIGLFIGNCCGNWLSKKEKWNLFGIGFGQATIGLFCLISLALVSRLPYWTEGISSVSALATSGAQNVFLRNIFLKGAYCVLVVLPPTILWGSVFPLASRVFLQGQRGIATRTGLLTGWNTVGSALGSLLGSFVLIELLGLRDSIILGAMLNLVAAVGLLCVSRTRLSGKQQVGIWGIGIVAVLTIVILPPWDRFEMSTSFLKPGQDVEDAVEMLYYHEDAYGITSVAHFLPYDQKYLTTNRLYCQSTADLGGPEDHRRLGYIPLLLHPEPKQVLITGLGSGVTLRGAAEYGDVQIDCVEISQSVVEAAQCFREENGNVLERENVHIVTEDARNYIARTDQKYDVIIGDIVFPMSSGSSSLFSKEYYDNARAKLKENGIMVQWIPIHQFSKQELELTANTFANVFPHSYYIWGMIGSSVPVVGLVGVDEQLTIDMERLQDTYNTNTTLREELEKTALDDPYMLISHYIGEIQSVQTEIITDDKPILEYINPRVALSYAERGRENMKWLVEQKTSANAIAICSDQEQKQTVDEYDEMIVKYICDYVLG